MQPTTSRFDGSFTGEIATTQNDQTFGETINLNLTVSSPLTGTFFRQSDGVTGTISGDVTDNSATFTGTTTGDCFASFDGSLSLINDGEISMEIQGTDCDGQFTSSGILGSIPCIDIAGRYDAAETVTYTCTIGGESETETLSGEGAIELVQSGCNISYSVPGIAVIREGEIEGNALKMTGPFIVPLDQSVSLQENTFTADVTIVDEYNFTFNGTGSAKGTVNGIGFSCTGNSTGRLRKSFGVAVAVLRGGIGIEGEVEVDSPLDMIRSQAIRVDPKRVIGKGFRDGPDQLARVAKWLNGLANSGGGRPRVALIGHSLGGDAVRRANFSNMCSRITIDPINPLVLPVLNQRDRTFSPVTTAGRFINVLASTTEDLEGERGLGLLGHRITGVSERVENMPPTNHFTVVTRVLVSGLVSEEVQTCLNGGSNLQTYFEPNKQFGAPLTKRHGNDSFYFTFGWQSRSN